MKRFWIEISNNTIAIDNANNNITTHGEGGQSYSIDIGTYTLEKLVSHLLDKGLDIKIGELKSYVNKKFLVIFSDESISNVTGSFVTFVGGIESIDNGYRVEETVE